MEFSVRIMRVAESVERTRSGLHIADQLMRAGTSPFGNHGEAEGAESRDDFIHKVSIAYKELRESRRWLRLIQRVPLVEKPDLLEGLPTAAEELVRIFAASLRTAKANREPRKKS